MGVFRGCSNVIGDQHPKTKEETVKMVAKREKSIGIDHDAKMARNSKILSYSGEQGRDSPIFNNYSLLRF
jgi:hypothetical protein